MQAAGIEWSPLSLKMSHYPGLGSEQGHFLLPIYTARMHRCKSSPHRPNTTGKQVGEDTQGEGLTTQPQIAAP